MKKYWYHYSTYTWTMVNIESWYLLKFDTYELKSITLNVWFLTFPLHTSGSWNFQMSSEVMNGEKSWSDGECTVVAKYTPAFVRPEWSGPNQRQIQNVPCTRGQISSGKLKSGGFTNMVGQQVCVWVSKWKIDVSKCHSTYTANTKFYHKGKQADCKKKHVGPYFWGRVLCNKKKNPEKTSAEFWVKPPAPFTLAVLDSPTLSLREVVK